MLLSLPDHIISQLRALRAQQQYWDEANEVIEREEAFMLSPGMGYAYYFTVDRRVLVDGSDWDGSSVREATDDEALSAIVVGAKNTGIGELLSSPCLLLG